jgi:hypothetical protein
VQGIGIQFGDDAIDGFRCRSLFDKDGRVRVPKP